MRFSGYRAVNFFPVCKRNEDLGLELRKSVFSTKLNVTFAEDNNLGTLALHRLSLCVSDHKPVTSLCLFCPQQSRDGADPGAVWGIHPLGGTS